MLNTCCILNGPPNSGKDTIANMMVDYGFRKCEMKARLYQDTADYFDVDLKELTRRATDRDLKEQRWDDLSITEVFPFGLSPRDALIHTSERVIKPNHGDDYFGRAAAESCVANYAMLSVFSDGGFASEIKPLQEVYKNVLIFRLHRAGCDFSTDSRDYLDGLDNTYDIFLIDGEPELACAQIINTIEPFITNIKAA